MWLLARQWQLGEFQGEDAGSPLSVDVGHHATYLNEVSLSETGPFAGLSLPLEALVEREAVPWDYRRRVQVGQQFERFLRTEAPESANSAIDAFRDDFPMPPATEDLETLDRTTKRFVQFMAGKVIDGQKLWNAIMGEQLPSPADVGLTSSQLQAAVTKLRIWFGSLYTEPGTQTSPAWRPESLDYRFRVQARHRFGPPTILVAPSYRNGNLDWHTFSVQYTPQNLSVPTETQRYTPARVSFAGMPHPRWWAFEDSRTDFGALDVPIPDLARLMLMEFALVSGDDWFIVPLDVPVGSLTRILSVHVTNVFGETVPIPRASTVGVEPQHRWEVFTLSHVSDPEGEGSPILLIPPTNGPREESAPDEEVRFLRDEGANMVWGVEHTVLNRLGEPVSGFDAQTEHGARQRRGNGTGQPAAGVAASGGLKYRLATTVPANWIPFIPVSARAFVDPGEPEGSIRLVQAQMLLNEADAEPAPVSAVTRILEDVRWIHEEAVLRAGLKVQIVRQRMRSANGETYVWLGRRLVTGRGEGASGLRFDVTGHRGPQT
jgi:hypothetical protein